MCTLAVVISICWSGWFSHCKTSVSPSWPCSLAVRQIFFHSSLLSARILPDNHKTVNNNFIYEYYPCLQLVWNKAVARLMLSRVVSTFMADYCCFRNRLIKLSCILCLEGRVSRAESESGAKNNWDKNSLFLFLFFSVTSLYPDVTRDP